MAENIPPQSAVSAAAAAAGATTTTATTTASVAAAATGTTMIDSSRGMPYYEKLRKDLRDSINKKRTLDAQLTRLEDDIFRMETAYLDDTLHSGNIIKGFDGYMKAGAGGAGSSSAATGGGGGGGTGAGSSGAGGSGTATRRKGGTTEADRIFSKSSAAIGRDSPVNQAAGTTTTAVSTPGLGTPGSSHAATPTASGAGTPGATTTTIATTKAGGGGANKKKKKAAAAAAAAAVVDGDEETDGQQRKRTKITYGRD